MIAIEKKSVTHSSQAEEDTQCMKVHSGKY